VLTEYGIKIAPSTYYAALTRPPSRREIEDEKLMEEIQRVYDENYRVYGAATALTMRSYGTLSKESPTHYGLR
jgi:hypothetical protein